MCKDILSLQILLKSLSNKIWEWLGNYISQFPQDPEIPLLESHGLVYVQILQVVLNLIFSYDGKDFSPQVPSLRLMGLRNVGRVIISYKWGKKKLLSTSAFCMYMVISSFLFIWKILKTKNLFLASIHVEAVVNHPLHPLPCPVPSAL